MLQLQPLDSEMAGFQTEARHFPFRIGRALANDLVLEKNGVWDEHAQIVLSNASLAVVACGEARVRLNGKIVETQAELRSGDLIEVGTVRLRVALERACQKMTPRQFLGLAGLIFGITTLQVAIYFWLAGQ